MKIDDIMSAASALVSGDRRAAYGDPLDGFTRIAIFWNAHLHATGAAGPRPITALDVAWMMLEVKHGRAYTGPHRDDNYIDAAGFAGVAGEIASRLKSEAS
jgi:hypothetical protein